MEKLPLLEFRRLMIELITPASLLAQCTIAVITAPLQGVSDRSAVKASKKLAAILSRGTPPQNHYLLRAIHIAYVAAMQAMAEACREIASDQPEREAANALRELSRRSDFTDFRSDGEQMPLNETNAEIDRMFGGGIGTLDGSGGADPHREYNRIVVSDLRLWGVPLPPALESLFIEGADPYPSWHRCFRLAFGQQIAENAEARAIFTATRLAEIRDGGIELRLALDDGFGNIGAKIDRVDETLRRIDERVSAGGPERSQADDWWIDPAGGEPLMDKGMLRPGLSEAEVAAKAQLYGGKANLQFTPLDFVSLGHTFDREKAGHLVGLVVANAKPCSSYTLKARHGSGLSIALAQLVCAFDADPRVQVFSVVGDRPRTLRLLQALDRWQSKAAALANWASESAQELDRVLLVIDDVWGDAPIGDANLIRFRKRCSELFAAGGPKLTFVFGSFGAAKGLHEDAEVPLQLTDSDRAACYAKMAEAEPTIINGYVDGPPEARQLGDDAQALIDFHLQNGHAHRATVEHWLARIDDLAPPQKMVLATIAVAELLDLAVPEAVAIRLCQARGVVGVRDAEDIVALNDRLTILEESGPAVGLSCPWRAKSILRRGEWLNREFLLPTLNEIVEAALSIYEAGRADSGQCLDFARHVLQRLGKREYYPLEDKEQLGKEVLSQFLDRLAILSADWNVQQRAKWAGTLAPWADRPRPYRSEEANERQFRRQCAEFVGRLTEKCVRAIRKNEAELSPAVAVSLLRASRLLLSSRLYPEKSGGKDSAQMLADHLEYRLSRVGILRLIEIQLGQARQDNGYRANELLTTYCRFHAEWQAAAGWDAALPPRSLCRYMTRILGEGLKLMNRQNLTFDAGTNIECARYEWLPPEGRVRDQALHERQRYLNRADECVKRNPVGQKTWEARVRAAQSMLIGKPARARLR